MDSQKRFDEDYNVDCNECEHWWTNRCDGVKPSSETKKVPCNSFLATRRVVIPKQIEQLQKDVKRLSLGIIGLCIALLIYFGSHILNILTK